MVYGIRVLGLDYIRAMKMDGFIILIMVGYSYMQIALTEFGHGHKTEDGHGQKRVYIHLYTNRILVIGFII